MPLDLSKARSTLNKILSQHQLAKKTVWQEKQLLRQARRAVKHIDEAQKIVQEIAATIQESAHQQIASVVSRCLESVFGDKAYKFLILFPKRRGRTEAVLALERNGKVFQDPSNQVGGGVIDVAAFALRLVCLVLSKPKLRRLLLLDEPFRFVSEEYQPAVQAMLDQLSEELGVQIIQVTHSPALQVGKIVELYK